MFMLMLMLMLMFRCLMLVVRIVNVDVVQMDVSVATTLWKRGGDFARLTGHVPNPRPEGEANTLSPLYNNNSRQIHKTSSAALSVG
jgi:hypothetical protein